MIRVDAGDDLFELLARAQQLGQRARLDVAVPFFDADGELWTLLESAVLSGARVRLMTRPQSDTPHADLISDLRRAGMRMVPLPKIHAKSVLLTDRKGPHSMGWIGSHNFTKASERTAQELGVAFGGNGNVESRLLQQALIQFDAWDQQATATHPCL
jgi:phosphatidylserine/phosphatidylglycerophosphate/cardiolipin synthase-like enzyme